ncbi:MAG: pyridoxamine 5'-phosphate oxidase [Salaquimonas sp.]|nr:pyridoxamine 5'-phosphate oxidase [Salaquimonas sp.]
MDDLSTSLKNSDQSATDPMKIFAVWLQHAEKTEPNDPTAMALATVDADVMPNVRMVLMRRFDDRGIVFFTNFHSQKGGEILTSHKAAACFHWKSQRKSVRFRGPVEEVTAEEADDYFSSRARGSRIGAWASKQSSPLESRFALEKEVAKYAARFGVGDIPRPDYWSGFRICPLSIEFWSDGKFRLHDRLRYDRETLDAPWATSRLYP